MGNHFRGPTVFRGKWNIWFAMPTVLTETAVNTEKSVSREREANENSLGQESPILVS